MVAVGRSTGPARAGGGTRRPAPRRTSYTACMYYYGHGSWIAIVVFAGVFAVRALSSQRRRSSRPGGPSPRSSFTASRPGPPTPPVSGAAPSAPATGGGVAPGWFRDPTGRHAQRYWSGSDWTEHVMDDGVPAADPPPAPPRRATD